MSETWPSHQASSQNLRSIEDEDQQDGDTEDQSRLITPTASSPPADAHLEADDREELEAMEEESGVHTPESEPDVRPSTAIPSSSANDFPTMLECRKITAQQINVLIDNGDDDRVRSKCLEELADPLLPWYFRFRYSVVVAGLAKNIYDSRRYLEAATRALEMMEHSHPNSAQLAEMRDGLEDMRKVNDEEINAFEAATPGAQQAEA